MKKTKNRYDSPPIEDYGTYHNRNIKLARRMTINTSPYKWKKPKRRR